jgi:aspartate-semialdehyde dehydrogenase
VIKTLAVVGATGAVGRIVLEELEASPLQFEQLRLIASPRSAGQTITFRGKNSTVQPLEPAAFEGVEVVIASTPDDVAGECVPWAVERGAVVIDERALWRMMPDVPLVVPEVNAEALSQHRGIIASPNCSTTQMVLVLKPLLDRFGLKQVIVSTYQAVSGAGLAAQQELAEATRASLENQSRSPQIFPHSSGFNVIPQIGGPREQGFTSEESKMVHETRKILGQPQLSVIPTCVRVPVMIGHSESIYIESERPMTLETARAAMAEAAGLTLVDDLAAGHYPMPITAAGSSSTFVGRLRWDPAHPCGLSLWCVSDNLRKGAASNAVQIAEHLDQHPRLLIVS